MAELQGVECGSGRRPRDDVVHVGSGMLGQSGRVEKMEIEVEAEVELEYVGFWARGLAWVIDTVFVVVLTIPPLLAIFSRGYAIPRASSGVFAGAADVVAVMVVPCVAVIAFLLYAEATPGKMAIGARVVDERSGRTMSVWQAVGRCVSSLISWMPLGLGVLWVAVDSRKQAWHDKLAGTVVVRSKNRGREHVQFDVREEVVSNRWNGQ